MTRTWQDKQKTKARDCRYRDHNAPRERPSEYFMRKHQLLLVADDYDDTEIIIAIMEGAPKHWNTVIDTSVLTEPHQLLERIVYHEDSLMYSPAATNDLLHLS